MIDQLLDYVTELKQSTPTATLHLTKEARMAKTNTPAADKAARQRRRPARHRRRSCTRRKSRR